MVDNEKIDNRDDVTETGAEPISEQGTGTESGNPIAGVEMSDEDKEQAVEPDDNGAVEVDGPQAGHA